MLPYTEQTNPLSAMLDGSLDAEQFLLTLKACDTQVYNGFAAEYSLMDEHIITQIERSIDDCCELIKLKDSKIVMTGCGTSGRISFLTARRYNQILSKIRLNSNDVTLVHTDYFSYTCAGGDSALFLSDELPEDDPVQSIKDFQTACDNSAHSMLMGVTCGISAAYVAGQLAYQMDRTVHKAHIKSSICLVGFNPIELARDSPIDQLANNYSSFRHLCGGIKQAVDSSTADCAIINPVIGPEPVAGSSRMKGGTATLVILDVICLQALFRSGMIPKDHVLYALNESSTLDLLLEYQRVHSITYNHMSKNLPRVMTTAANSVRKKRHLYFVGLDSAGVMGGIDASEMPDTYGASFEQTRAFILHGWEEQGVGSSTGDLSGLSPLHRLGFDHFEADVLPSTTPDDTVCILLSYPERASSTDLESLHSLIAKISAKNVSIFLLCVSTLPLSGLRNINTLDAIISLIGGEGQCCFVRLSLLHTGFSDLAIKLMTNAVTTYAQAAGRGVSAALSYLFDAV